MTYEERIRLIAAKLNGFLRQFETPALSEAERMERIRIMADTANKRLSGSLNQDGLAERVGAGLTLLMETHRGYKWPMPADVARAFDKLPSDEVQDVDLLVWARAAWFHGNPKTKLPAKSVMPGADTWEIALRLIDEGADPWELRYAGFATEPQYYRDLEASGKGWHGHAAKMEAIRADNARLGAAK